MMKTPGTGPAIAPAEDRLVAEFLAHALKLRGKHVQGNVPLDFDEGFPAATLRIRARTVAEPGLPD